MNVVVNGGFEFGVLSPWDDYGTLASSVVTSSPGGVLPAEGDFFARLPGSGSGFTRKLGFIAQSGIPLVLGGTYSVSAFVNDTENTGGNTALVIDVDTGDGATFLNAFNVASVGLYDWTLVDLGTFVATGTAGAVYIFRDGGSGVNSHYVDGFAIEPPEAAAMRRSRWLAMQGLKTVLSTINGAPNYALNLGSRVYTRVFLPDESVTGLVPYVCIPLGVDAPRYEGGGDDTHVTMRWTVTVLGVVGETASSPFESNAVRDACYLHEDIMRALLLNPTLGGTVREVRLLDGGGVVAGIDDTPHGILEIPIELCITFALDNLGPST